MVAGRSYDKDDYTVSEHQPQPHAAPEPRELPPHIGLPANKIEQHLIETYDIDPERDPLHHDALDRLYEHLARDDGHAVEVARQRGRGWYALMLQPVYIPTRAGVAPEPHWLTSEIEAIYVAATSLAFTIHMRTAAEVGIDVPEGASPIDRRIALANFASTIRRANDMTRELNWQTFQAVHLDPAIAEIKALHDRRTGRPAAAHAQRPAQRPAPEPELIDTTDGWPSAADWMPEKETM